MKTFDSHERLRVHGAVRGAIIGYGIAAYVLLMPAIGPSASHRYPFLIGIALQSLVLVARRVVPSPALWIFELALDAVTVLLFAMATYGAIARYAGEL